MLKKQDLFGIFRIAITIILLSGCKFLEPSRPSVPPYGLNCNTIRDTQHLIMDRSPGRNTYSISISSINDHSMIPHVVILFSKKNRLRSISLENGGLRTIEFDKSGNLIRLNTNITYKMDTVEDGRVFVYSFYAINGYIFEFKRNGKLSLLCCRESNSIDTIYYYKNTRTK